MGSSDDSQREMGRIAAGQHGVVSLPQLQQLGFGKKQVGVMVKRDALRRVHPAVYFVGPSTGPLGREMAAVLACGPGAVVSHISAAYLHKLLPYPANPGPVHVTATGTHRTGSDGIVVRHWARWVAGAESQGCVSSSRATVPGARDRGPSAGSSH
jgi:hypothetical protein